jgi:hypothetical protein
VRIFTNPTGIFINPVTCRSTRAGTQGQRMKAFVPIHRNLRTDDDPELGFPGSKPVTGIRIFPKYDLRGFIVAPGVPP